jgi:hypothetical protein
LTRHIEELKVAFAGHVYLQSHLRVEIQQVNNLPLLVYHVIIATRLLASPVELLSRVRRERELSRKAIRVEVLSVEARCERLVIHVFACQEIQDLRAILSTRDAKEG